MHSVAEFGHLYSLATAAENVDGNDKLVKYGGFA